MLEMELSVACGSVTLPVASFIHQETENNKRRNVGVIRMEQRSGLIRARLKGAAVSKGQVITFLDAHCECTVGWLPASFSPTQLWMTSPRPKDQGEH